MHTTDDTAQPIDTATRDGLLATLLLQHPGAIVSAYDGDGRPEGLPEGLHLSRHVFSIRSPLELVAGSSQPGLFESWEQAKLLGAASLEVELVDGTRATCHIVDMRHRHGALIGVMAGDGPMNVTKALGLEPDVMPKTGRVDKDDLAIIRYVDGRICRILGYEPSDLIGKRSLGLIHPEDQQRALGAWRDMLASPGLTTRVRARHLHGDGSWIWMELTNNNLLAEPERRVVTEMIDISEEMSAVETLRQREQLLTRLAEALPTGVLHVDRRRNVRYSNSRLHRLLGTTPSSTVADQLAAVHPDDRPVLSNALDGVLAGGGDADVEVGVRVAGARLTRRCAIAIRALTDSDDVTVGAVLCIDDVTESLALRTELERRATIDDLTGCLNRGAVLEELQRSLLHNAAGTRGTAIVFLDLDGFKEVNDTFGHLAGDQLLSSAARRLCGAMRDQDVIGRLGGDEFLILLPGIRGVEAAMTMAARLGDSLAEPLEVVMGLPTRIRSSIGVAWSDSSTISGDALVAAADIAMYVSKASRACEPILADL